MTVVVEVAAGAPPVGRRERAVLLAGAVALGVAVIATRAGLFTPDTRPDLYQQPGRFLADTLSAWVGGATGLGQANFNAGTAPVAALMWVIRSLGASPWLAVRIWRLLLLLVGAWGIRRYLGALLGARLTPAGRLLATAFWVANPYVIVAGSTTPILLPYVLLPWMLLAFLHATRQPRSWRWPALFALAFFAQGGLNAGVVPFFQLLALPAHVLHARYAEGRRWRDLVGVVVRCGVFAVLVSLYWLLPTFLASATGAGIAGSTEAPRDIARTSSYAETARLLGNWPLYGRAGNRLFLGSYTVFLTNRLVVVATFAVPVAVGLALWRAKARERFLVVILFASALPVMVGAFPPDHPYLSGRLLESLFRNVPAALAFRTTNKVGAVVALAECIALAFGARVLRARTVDRGRILRGASLLVVAALMLGVSAPLWSGGLYPLGYRIPKRWHDATRALDGHARDQRVLVVPGGTGGNYRWGMRSPDDLFPSLLRRPVAERSTVVGRGDPAGNLLSAFDTQLAQGALPPSSISAMARYLGAADVLVRNDLLTEEIGGPQPASVVAAVTADGGLKPEGAYGERGDDTVPGSSGPASVASRKADPRDAAVRPLLTYRVRNAEPLVHAAPASSQVLVDGDGDALPILAGSRILDGTQPVRQLGDLDARSFAQAVSDGGRIVLTDTNRRRAWDLNRTSNATTATLEAGGDIDSGNGTTTTRWPDDPRKQSVSQIDGAASVQADRPGFGVFPFARPSNAFDSDPTTAWLTGGFHTAAGTSIRLDLGRTVTVRSLTIQAATTEPSTPTGVEVLVGDKRVAIQVAAGGQATTVPIPATRTRTVKLTILGQSPGNNPVGFTTIRVNDLTVRDVLRLPETYRDLVQAADPATRRAAARLPLDIVLTRAQANPVTADDDEEAQLDRSFELPSARTFAFTGALNLLAADPAAVAEAQGGRTSCRSVGLIDGRNLQARISSTPDQLARGDIRLTGCGSLRLGAGTHQLRTIFGWRLDRARFSSDEGRSRPAVVADPIRITHRSATRVSMEVAPSRSGSRLLRLGQSSDPRWRLLVDGHDAGAPIVLDGYSVGWRIDGGAHELLASFGPQRAVAATFEISLVALLAILAIALLPDVPTWIRRRSTRAAPRPVLAAAGPAPDPVAAPVPVADGFARSEGAPRSRPVLRLPWVALWVALTALGVVLDGVTGVILGLVVAVVVLARVPRRVLGALGVASLVAVPVVLLGRGLPSDQTVSPLFAVGSLWPHHLMFAGLVLVGVAAVSDLGDHLRATARHADEGDPPSDPGTSLPTWLRRAAVAGAAVAALVIGVVVWIR
jgi:hypothetical protein